jgi:hypothetical protein
LFVHGLVKTVYLLYRLIQDFERTGRGGPLLLRKIRRPIRARGIKGGRERGEERDL